MDAMKPEHLNPAQRLVARYICALSEEVGDALQTLKASGCAELPFAKFARLMDETIRGFVAEGYWRDAGITDVRELYDLHVHVGRNDEKQTFDISVQMPHVMSILARSDDPDAN
jgi:hypothetical protein